MKRFAIAAALLAAIAAAALIPAHPSRGAPLWPGARFSTGDRDRAVQRGLSFIYRIAKNPAYFQDWGHDLLSAFWNIAQTSSDLELSRLARSMGRERAIEWRRLHPHAPADGDVEAISELVFGADAAEGLGVPDPRLRAELLRAAARFSASDYLSFDPLREPPPTDVPQPCSRCGKQNARGAQTCARCGAPLRMWSRYAVFMDALIATYTGDQYGVTLGAHYSDVLRWLPAMRPYPIHGQAKDSDYYDAIYSATHVVYTYNEYCVYRIPPDCFRPEFEYLKANLPEAIHEKDSETLGEYLDTLRSFGLTISDPVLQRGIDYLLSTQNSDGSWGNPHGRNPYDRYHPTWTAVGGLHEYRWKGLLPCPAL
jgi:hypothetical protein